MYFAYSDKRGRTSSGFTLTELLIVIVIIAILSAILYPVLSHARDKRNSVACLGNQKQIGIALMSYAQDYGETLPFYFFGPDGKASGTDGRYKWMDAVYPYIKDENVFNCPSDHFPSAAKNGEVNHGYKYKNGTDYGSYLMNATYRYDNGPPTPPSGRYADKPIKVGQIKNPATTIYIADTAPDPRSGTWGANFGWSCLSSQTGQSGKPCIPQPEPLIDNSVRPPQIDRMVARHSGLVNVIYCDGHARAISLQTIAAPKKSGGTRAADGTITAFTIEDD